MGGGLHEATFLHSSGGTEVNSSEWIANIDTGIGTYLFLWLYSSLFCLSRFVGFLIF